MPARTSARVPSLSEIVAWDTDHIVRAADGWVSAADHWEGTFDAVHRGLAAPGGTTWDGAAADAARERASGDLVVVRGLAEALRDTAAAARRGAAHLDDLRRQAVDAINQARAAGFTVAEDFSVSATSGLAANQLGTARLHAATIAARAAALGTADSDVAARITTLTTTLDAHGFGEESGGTVHALDFPQGPLLPIPERPWEYNTDYTTTLRARGPDGRVVDAGSLVSLDDVWNELHRCFNCNFPIGGAPEAFPKVGDELPLEMRAGSVQLAHLPVKVTQVNRTADAIDIEFATLPGHVDGPGSTIHFRWTEQDGAPHLAIRGYITEGPGSGENPFSAPARVGYTALAEVVWQPYIDNVISHVVQAKGYDPVPVAVPRGR